MGGDVFIGIRKRNGEIYLAERWTNPTSYWFNDPAMYDVDEKTLDNYIELPEEPRPQTEIHPSEYGVILYDALNNKLFSRQDYTSVGRLIVSLFDPENMELAQVLRQRGIVTELRAFSLGNRDNCSWGQVPKEAGPFIVTPEKWPRFFEIIEEVLSQGRDHVYELPNSEKAMFEVGWKIPGLEVDHLKAARGWNHWPEVLKWVSDQGWPVPIWPQEKVDAKYHHLEEDA